MHMCYPVHPVLLENPSSPPQVVLPPPHQSRIAGRVRSHLPQWKKISGPWHTKTIMDGIPLQWVQDPPPFNRPFDSAISLRSRSKEFEGCSKTLQHYLEIGSVVPLLNQDETDGVWSTFFPVAKKGTDKLRGCIDLRTINPFLRYEHFKMEGTHTLASMLRRRDWMTKIDLSDFYMHLPIAEADRKYFRFMFNGIKYECVAMPFGLAPAPRIATKFLQPVIKYLRRRGVRCTVYIDDIIILARSRVQSLKHTQLAVDLLHSLGFGIHPDKLQGVPRQSVEFLGFQVNSVKMQFRVPLNKIRDLRRQIHLTLLQSQKGQLTVRRFASLIGKINFLRGAVSAAPLHIWPLLQLHSKAFKRASEWDKHMTLSPRATEELRWWQEEVTEWNGKSVIPAKHQYILTTDASHWGWGGWWKQVGHRPRRTDEARGFFSRRESRNSSNWRELTAVALSLKSSASMLRQKVVLVETDNSATKAYINHMGGRTLMLSSIAREIWHTAHRYGIHLIAVHRPGKLNERADRLSRWTRDSSDLKLDPAVFKMADRKWGPHSVDLFATRLNRQVHRYVSWKPDPNCIAADGLRFSIGKENSWCFPPEALISKLLAKVVREQATITLVAPLWPSKPWWPELQALRIDRPILLEPREDLLQTTGLNTFSGFRHLRLAIWRISGSHWKIARYQTQLARS